MRSLNSRVTLFLSSAVLLLGSCGLVVNPDPPTGVYHLTGILDATNLNFDSSGRYSLHADGCDNERGGAGRVEVKDGATVLIPDEDASGDRSFPIRAGGDQSGYETGLAARVELRNGAGGTLVTTIDGESLVWHPGRVCSVCDPGGGTAFSTGIEPCD